MIHIEHWLRTVALRMRSLFRRNRVEQELNDEMQFHLERQIEQHIAQGLTPEEARYAALRAIGGIEQRKEECRDTRRVRFLEDLVRDAGYGLRALRKSPVFTATAILSLTLGIGLNTAVFSMVHAVLLRSLPADQPEHLVLIRTFSRNGRVDMFANPDYEQLRNRASMFSGVLAASSVRPVDVGLGPETERAQAEIVSDNYFSVLGVEPAMGRTFAKADAEAPVAVISDRFWKRRLNEDPFVVGRTLSLNGTAFSIIGVAPPQFAGITAGMAPDVWVPISMVRAVVPSSFDLRTVRYVDWLHVIGRLSSGVTMEQARISMDLLVSQIQEDLGIDPQRDYLHHIELEPGSGGVSFFRGRFGFAATILWAAVALVLLVACLNLAGMLLARGTARHREIATRLAIGATRTRLLRQLMTESALLTVFGGAFGLLFSVWCARFIAGVLSTQGLMSLDLAIDARVLSFTAIVVLITSVLFGMAPAIQTVRHVSGRRERQRLRQALLVGQVALSLVVLAGAGLFIGTLRNLKTVDTGFKPTGVLQVRFEPARDGNTRLRALATKLAERVSTIPGVTHVSYAVNGALSYSGSGVTGLEFDVALPNDLKDKRVSADWVGPAYFQTLGIPVIEGREFSNSDTANSARVVIVNQTMARQFFGQQAPVGRRLRWNKEEWEVVGVAKDAKYRELRETTPPMLYFASLQNAALFNILEIRTTHSALSVAAAVREAIREVDPALRVGSITTLSDRIDEKLAAERLVAGISGFFGGFTLFLVSVGIYGMLAHSVAQRTNEIGVRIALGAQRNHVILMIVRNAGFNLAAGLLLGIPAILVSGQLVSSMLFGVTPMDPFTIGLSAVIVCAIGVIAAYIPARRAARIDPVAALKYE